MLIINLNLSFVQYSPFKSPQANPPQSAFHLLLKRLRYLWRRKKNIFPNASTDKTRPQNHKQPFFCEALNLADRKRLQLG